MGYLVVFLLSHLGQQSSSFSCKTAPSSLSCKIIVSFFSENLAYTWSWIHNKNSTVVVQHEISLTPNRESRAIEIFQLNSFTKPREFEMNHSITKSAKVLSFTICVSQFILYQRAKLYEKVAQTRLFSLLFDVKLAEKAPLVSCLTHQVIVK